MWVSSRGHVSSWGKLGRMLQQDGACIQSKWGGLAHAACDGPLMSQVLQGWHQHDKALLWPTLRRWGVRRLSQLVVETEHGWRVKSHAELFEEGMVRSRKVGTAYCVIKHLLTGVEGLRTGLLSRKWQEEMGKSHDESWQDWEGLAGKEAEQHVWTDEWWNEDESGAEVVAGTYGSTLGEEVGWAWVAESGEREVCRMHHTSDYTNNSAELQVVIQLIKGMPLRTRLTVHTDSQHVIDTSRQILDFGGRVGEKASGRAAGRELRSLLERKERAGCGVELLHVIKVAPCG